MKYFLTILKELKNAFALNYVMSIFNNDEHKIISKKGIIILNNKLKNIK